MLAFVRSKWEGDWDWLQVNYYLDGEHNKKGWQWVRCEGGYFFFYQICSLLWFKLLGKLSINTFQLGMHQQICDWNEVSSLILLKDDRQHSRIQFSSSQWMHHEWFAVGAGKHLRNFSLWKTVQILTFIKEDWLKIINLRVGFFIFIFQLSNFYQKRRRILNSFCFESRLKQIILRLSKKLLIESRIKCIAIKLHHHGRPTTGHYSFV